MNARFTTSLKLVLEFALTKDARPTTVTYDTRSQRVTIDGPLYPSDLRTLNAVILSIRDQRDRYPPVNQNEVKTELDLVKPSDDFPTKEQVEQVLCQDEIASRLVKEMARRNRT